LASWLEFYGICSSPVCISLSSENRVRKAAALDFSRSSSRLSSGYVPSCNAAFNQHPPGFSFLFYIHYFVWSGFYTCDICGLVAGYLAYDTVHYAVHHFAFRIRVLLNIKKHHMKHHYIEPDEGFGVSSPLWDYVSEQKA